MILLDLYSNIYTSLLHNNMQPCSLFNTPVQKWLRLQVTPNLIVYNYTPLTIKKHNKKFVEKKEVIIYQWAPHLQGSLRV